jgi:hypothetical protein
MRYTHAISLALVIGSCFLAGTEAQAQRQAAKAEPVPDTLQLLTNESLDDFPAFTRDIIVWPDKVKTERNTLDPSSPLVAAGISNTLRWLELVLQPHWVPSLEDSPSVIPLALRADVQGNDAVRLRFKIHDTVIQVVSTSSGLNLLIQGPVPPKSNGLVSQAEALSYIGTKIDQYLQHSQQVKAVSLKLVREQGRGFRGDPEVRPETCDHWWGLVAWWTDGNVVLFSIGKAEGGASEPVLKANWLSSSP